jgi:protein TonB
VLRVKLNVDANGAVLDIMPEEKVNPANLPAIREAVQQWRFTPARQNGHSVAAEVVVPILCQAPPRSGPGTAATVAPATNARPIKRVPPEYPSALRRAGVSGHAIVDFDVDVNGDVRDAIAVSATDPAFAQPAVAAISQWKFEPARRADGHPVEQHQRVPVVFGRAM